MRLRLAAKARNINNPNAKIAITPTVIEDIVATKQKNELIKYFVSSEIQSHFISKLLKNMD